MLVKLTPGVNVTNILRAAFLQKFCSTLFCIYILGLNFFWQKNIGANALVKLTASISLKSS
jgi:hypothetical protein